MDLSAAAAEKSSQFEGPRAIRKIATQKALVEFIQSEAYAEFIQFILDLQEAVKGKLINPKTADQISPVSPYSCNWIAQFGRMYGGLVN